MIDAASIIRLIRDARATIHTSGETLDAEGHGVTIPETLNVDVQCGRNSLVVNLSPGIVIDKALSWWKFSAAALLSSLVITERDVVAVTNWGRRRIAVLAQAEAAYGASPEPGGFAWLAEAEPIES